MEESHWLHQEAKQLLESPALAQDENLAGRAEAAKTLELWESQGFDFGLKARVAQQKIAWQAQNQAIFDKYRAWLQKPQRPEDVRALFGQFTDYRPGSAPSQHYQPDSLDLLVDGVLGYDLEKSRLPKRHKEMVHLEVTPASVVLEMTERLAYKAGEVLYDLGAGLGHTLWLAHLLTGLQGVGIELEPTYCSLATKAMQNMQESHIVFEQSDVLEADMSQADIIYMFSPFTGSLLSAVLHKIETEGKHGLRICAYGAINETLQQQPWLALQGTDSTSAFQLAIFNKKH